MKTSLISLYAMAAIVAGGTMFSSCNSDNDGYFDYDPKFSIVTFENDITLAGPTSYGENLYSVYDGKKFTNASIEVAPDGTKLLFGLNNSSWTGEPEFYAGGMALSTWNYRSNPPTETEDGWWKSYKNQCSVYNAASTDGTNKLAGGPNPLNTAIASNVFAIINGCDQAKYNSTLEDHCAEITFSSSAEYTIPYLQVCPSSYVYGCIAGPNPFGCSTSLRDARGYFCLKAYGYDAKGQATNNGNPVVFYFCDFRTTATPVVDYRTGWNDWSLLELGKVNKVRFDFDGSDVGEYGLNTPAYACLDNFMIQFKD